MHKAEFEAAYDWLKFGFHSKQDFPLNLRESRIRCVIDKELDIYFTHLNTGPCLTLYELSELEESFAKCIGNEYIGYGNHEQYFYPEYFNYQPNYAEKFYKSGEILKRNVYTFITADDIVKAIAGE